MNYDLIHTLIATYAWKTSGGHASAKHHVHETITRVPVEARPNVVHVRADRGLVDIRSALQCIAN